MVRRVLEEAGHTVLEAANGRDGVALCRREVTDIVVTDLYMPGMDGIEVIREVRKASAHQKLICMSGGGKRDVFDWGASAMAVGADKVLVKPFDPPHLLSVIREVLDSQGGGTMSEPSLTKATLRKHTRFPVHLPVSFGEAAVEQRGTVLDISPEGCRIYCPDDTLALPYFQAQIQLTESRTSLCVDLAVRRWSRNGELGVEFIRMKPDDQGRLRTLIHNCAKVGAQTD